MDQPDGPVTRGEFRQEIAGLEGRLVERLRLMQTEIEEHTIERTGLMRTETAERTGLMQTEIEQRMELMQTEIEEHTTERMRLMQTEIEQRMELMQTEIEEHTTERTRDMQTEVIRVFMEFQQRNESRDGSLDKATAGLSERLGMVERRLFQIERKLLLEPPAA